MGRSVQSADIPTIHSIPMRHGQEHKILHLPKAVTIDSGFRLVTPDSCLRTWPGNDPMKARSVRAAGMLANSTSVGILQRGQPIIEIAPPLLELMLFDGGSHLLHELQVIMQIVDGVQTVCQQFARHEKMAQIAP